MLPRHGHSDGGSLHIRPADTALGGEVWLGQGGHQPGGVHRVSEQWPRPGDFGALGRYLWPPGGFRGQLYFNGRIHRGDGVHPESLARLPRVRGRAVAGGRRLGQRDRGGGDLPMVQPEPGVRSRRSRRRRSRRPAHIIARFRGVHGTLRLADGLLLVRGGRAVHRRSYIPAFLQGRSAGGGERGATPRGGGGACLYKLKIWK